MTSTNLLFAVAIASTIVKTKTEEKWKMYKNTANRLRILIQKWKEANTPGNRVDLNRLADETLTVVNSDPFLQEVCDIFLYSISIKSINDKKFEEFMNQQQNIMDRDIKRQAG